MRLALSLKSTSEGPLSLVICSLAYSRAVEAKLPFFELLERAARQSHRARQGSNPRRDRGYLNGRYRRDLAVHARSGEGRLSTRSGRPVFALGMALPATLLHGSASGRSDP